MQPREKILAGALAAVVVFWLARPAFKSVVVDPFQDRNNTISRLEGAVTNLQLQQVQLLEAARVHTEWLNGSLPPEVLAAQREYRNWVYAMARLAGWEELEVSSVGQSSRYDSFTTISTTLEGRTTLDGVNHFLTLMESTGLVQRVSALDIESTDSEGNPVMIVSVTLEGVAMVDAAERSKLFPTALLVESCSREDEAVRVDSAIGFPEAPFRVRINNEVLGVNGAEGGTWTVKRGLEETRREDHSVSDVVELLPEREVEEEGAGRLLVVDEIFVLPRIPGQLKFAELPPAVRGRDFSSTLEVENWDPRYGPQRIDRIELLGGGPEGSQFDPASGRLDWEVPDDAELTTYDLDVAAYGSDDELILEGVLELAVRRPNDAPQLVLPDEIIAYLGRELVFVPEVDDPDLPEDDLSFELIGNVPEGSRFDRRTGEFRWTPPITEDLGRLELQLKVTDAGTPPKTVEDDLVLDLRDDSAVYTYLIYTLLQGEDHVAVLYDRSMDERTRLNEGDEFRVADIVATVETIRFGAIEFRSDGALYELSVGDNLRDWRLIEAADASEDRAALGVVDE